MTGRLRAVAALLAAAGLVAVAFGVGHAGAVPAKPGAAAQDAPDAAVGPRPETVIMVNWAGNGTTPPAPVDSVSPRTVKNQITDASARWQQYSYGRFAGWTPNVVGPFTIPTPPLDAGGVCGQTFKNSVINSALQVAGISRGVPDAFLIYFPKVAICGFSAEAQHPGIGRFFLLNGTVRFETIVQVLGLQETQPRTANVQYAHTQICVDAAGRPTPLSTNCQMGDDDPYSVLGRGAPLTSPSVLTKQYQRWLDGRVQDASQVGGTFTIAPVESMPVGAPQALRLLDGAETLWLEYRRAVGPDAGIRTKIDGVLIYRQGHLEGEPDQGQTLLDEGLLDMTPGAGGRTFEDAVLRVGSSWTNPLGNTRITVNSISDTGATVTITPVNPTATVPDARGVWSIYDDGAAAHVSFLRAGGFPLRERFLPRPFCANDHWVLGQRPAPGARIQVGSTVDVDIADPFDPFCPTRVIPNVVGKFAQDAVNTLDDNRFHVSIEYKVDPFCLNEGKVVRQSGDAGTPAPNETTVFITVSKRPDPFACTPPDGG